VIETQGSALKLLLIVLLVLMLPVSAVQAETADEVRKRALQAITNQMVGPLKLWSIKSLRKSGIHKSSDKRSKVKSISCTQGPERSVVFQLEMFEKGQKPWTTKITFSDKIIILPPDGSWEGIKMPTKDRPTSVMVSIDSGSPHLKKAKLSTGGRMYADYPIYRSHDATKAGRIRAISLKSSETGLLYTGEYGEVYQMPLRRNTIPNATAVCKAKDAEEIQTILKRIQHVSAQ